MFIHKEDVNAVIYEAKRSSEGYIELGRAVAIIELRTREISWFSRDWSTLEMREQIRQNLWMLGITFIDRS